jgi:hypothetical protein
MSKAGSSRATPSAKRNHSTKKAPKAGVKAASVPSPTVARGRDANRGRESSGTDRVSLCRSCGKRPGKPTAILGQMMQAELCTECAALR